MSFNINTWAVGRAKDYKKVAYLLEYDPSWALVRTWKLFGCWVGSIDNGNYSNESNEKKTISAQINYDYAKMELSEIE